MLSKEREAALAVEKMLRRRTRLILAHLVKNHRGFSVEANRVVNPSVEVSREYLMDAAEAVLRAEEHLDRAAFREAEEALDALPLAGAQQPAPQEKAA